MKETAELKWDEGSRLQYVNNNLDIKPGQLTVIIGTLFKEMALKPSILKNLQGVLGMRKFSKGLYVSDDDYAVIEDNSGRIRIKKTESFDISKFVTGSVIGLKGVADKNGFFEVKDYCYAGIPF